MILSMTGFGRASSTGSSPKLSAEIRTLNSKYYECTLKLPTRYSDYEHELRNYLSNRLLRGKINCSVKLEEEENSDFLSINKAAYRHYVKQLEELNPNLANSPEILRLPGVLKGKEEDKAEDELKRLKQLLDEAMDEVVQFRKEEGRVLQKEMVKYLSSIRSEGKQIDELKDDRIDVRRETLRSKLASIQEDGSFDKQRLEQEMIYFIEKLDINEELVRLFAHLNAFEETLESNKPEAGKRLNFISQEIGREVNTIGSKSQDAQMQLAVVVMKEELEKIKEQVNNIV